MYRVISLLIVLSLISCGGGGSGFEFSSPIKLWQSYAASPAVGVHYWNGVSQEYTVNKIDRINEGFRSGYGFVDTNLDLIFLNLATGEKYKYNNEHYDLLNSTSENLFESNGRVYFMVENSIKSCEKKSLDSCLAIDIIDGSFPYVFAESKGKVLVVTNLGDAVRFNGETWCRMARDANDVFTCNPQEPMVTAPRKIQFYSSIKYKGETLVGEWPTGSVYTFDGDSLKPSTKWTPPTMLTRERIGYEAQSMAEYCGDLFVGYWPKGEVWRYSRELNRWEYFKRLFGSRGDDTFIPWVNRPADSVDSAFFGQRVTALIPYKNSLFAVTSNLRSWDAGVFPDHLLPDELDEYGAIYEIKGKDCLTVYGNE